MVAAEPNNVLIAAEPNAHSSRRGRPAFTTTGPSGAMT
jgi:hypothetical protein